MKTKMQGLREAEMEAMINAARGVPAPKPASNDADRRAAVQQEIRDFDTHCPCQKKENARPPEARIQHLMHMAVELDQRGLEAVINCAAFHRRYPKGA